MEDRDKYEQSAKYTNDSQKSHQNYTDQSIVPSVTPIGLVPATQIPIEACSGQDVHGFPVSACDDLEKINIALLAMDSTSPQPEGSTSPQQTPQQSVSTQSQHVPHIPASGLYSASAEGNNSITSLQQSLNPTPAQSEPQNMVDRNVTTDSTATLLDKVKLLVSCSTCGKIFNRTVVCHEYQIQLNRPVQCACGCVICTLCYREQEGCHVHVVSKNGTVNSTASTLASCSDLEHIGVWDIELDIRDQFKTEDAINSHVQGIMNGPDAPDMTTLKNGKCNPHSMYVVWAVH